jgi:hypothetical protein
MVAGVLEVCAWLAAGSVAAVAAAVIIDQRRYVSIAVAPECGTLEPWAFSARRAPSTLVGGIARGKEMVVSRIEQASPDEGLRSTDGAGGSPAAGPDAEASRAFDQLMASIEELELIVRWMLKRKDNGEEPPCAGYHVVPRSHGRAIRAVRSRFAPEFCRSALATSGRRRAAS